MNRPRKHAEEKVLPLGDGVSLSEIGSQLGHTTLPGKCNKICGQGGQPLALTDGTSIPASANWQPFGSQIYEDTMPMFEIEDS